MYCILFGILTFYVTLLCHNRNYKLSDNKILRPEYEQTHMTNTSENTKYLDTYERSNGPFHAKIIITDAFKIMMSSWF